MKKVIFSTNLPSPYRVDFFNELGKYCDLTVLYERKRSSERDKKWVGESAKNFKEIYLNLEPVGTDRSKGHALRDYIKTGEFDILIFTNYVSPATIEAILYCRIRRISYFIEYDGGFSKKDKFPKGILKKILLKGAKGHFTTADEHINYLMSLGIDQKNIYKYPFTSIRESDLQKAKQKTENDKTIAKRRLDMREGKIILSIGRFSYDKGYGKGYDVLLNVAKVLTKDIGIYIVGDEPTQEFIDIKKNNNLENVHFVGFKTKQDLEEYYVASDLFVLLTRGDVWGLVINEAMMHGLPVITTPYCIAGTELVNDGENGYLVDLNDPKVISDKCENLLLNDDEYKKSSDNCYKKVNAYTIEKMVERHIDIFNSI